MADTSPHAEPAPSLTTRLDEIDARAAEDTAQRRSEFVTAHRDFDADGYARRSRWDEWDCSDVRVLDNQAQVTR